MDIRAELEKRILIIDGAMGTMIQRYILTEEDFRGERFKDHPCDVKGNNDLLNLTRPDIIKAIQTEYLKAGAEVEIRQALSSSLADPSMPIVSEPLLVRKEETNSDSLENEQTRLVAAFDALTEQQARLEALFDVRPNNERGRKIRFWIIPLMRRLPSGISQTSLITFFLKFRLTRSQPMFF